MPKMPKNAENFNCDLCYFHCNKNSNWIKHLSTRKHSLNHKKKQMETQETFLETLETDKTPEHKYSCINCNKGFMVRSGLWKHKKICMKDEHLQQCTDNVNSYHAPEKREGLKNQLTSNKESDVFRIFIEQNQAIRDVLLEKNKEDREFFLQQNKEDRELFLEQNNKLIEIVQNANTINGNNNTINKNKTFNLNFFLNEQCKNAMNLKDFINNIQIEIEDLEDVGKNGYVEGITNIIVKQLNNLDMHTRPIHCTDLKREVLYIKDKDEWNKDNVENEKLRNLIHKVSTKNINKISSSMHLYPNYTDADSSDYRKFHNMCKNSVGNSCEDENKKMDEKIIRNISKNVVISREPTINLN
jgi:hypothetical protein